ncbi:single-stranded DNA-binding protein [Paenirhodobacter populi]|uniref:single-stranded DNA-binding protein n=1 Tax=Paenirhodobacter populi TaxID=2306993 RepID=UPI0013E3B407|nr:single-stranded DNA-binding protein [Sinirhodobacter populi]
MFSQVTHYGRIASAPEIRRYPDGGCVVSFRFVTEFEVFDHQTKTHKRIANFHNIEVNGRNGKYVMKAEKGQRMHIVGLPITRKFNNGKGEQYFHLCLVNDRYGHISFGDPPHLQSDRVSDKGFDDDFQPIETQN